MGRVARTALAVAIGAAGADAQGAQGAGVSTQLRAVASRHDEVTLRQIADSILGAPGTSPADRAEASYWRATVRVTRDSVTRALLAFIVDFPLAPRVEDALAQLGDDAAQRGDRAAARAYYEQLVRDNLRTDVGARAAQAFAQMQDAEGNHAAACATLAAAQRAIAPASVELATQVAYALRSCASVDSTTSARRAVTTDSGKARGADSVTAPRTDSAAPPSAAGARPATKPAAKTAAPAKAGPKRGTTWSVQVAAFDNRADALRLAARLTARDLDARVTNETPYRVRIGRFTSRDQATALVKKLAAEKTTAIVVEAERP